MTYESDTTPAGGPEDPDQRTGAPDRDVTTVLDPRLEPGEAYELVDRDVAPNEGQNVDFSDAVTGILDIRTNLGEKADSGEAESEPVV